MHDEYFFIFFFKKTFGLHFAIFEIFWPSLILNLYFALRFALLYFDLHFVKLILFCSERWCENMRFALLQSVLAVRHCSSNHLLLFFGVETFSMLTLSPKCLSEHEKIESENLFNVSLMLFSLLFCCNDEDNEFNRSLRLETLFLKSSTLSLSHISFLTYVVSLLGVLVHVICL